nr:MAG TPA: hypothetical protein [Microviridae sp.]
MSQSVSIKDRVLSLRSHRSSIVFLNVDYVMFMNANYNLIHC